MKLAPASLLWRTVAVVVAALVLSQAMAWWIFDEYVTEPRVALATRQFVSHLRTITTALQSTTGDSHQAFVNRLSEQEGFRISSAAPSEAMRRAEERPRVRAFGDRLRETFGPDAQVLARADDLSERPPLTVKLRAGDTTYWIGVPRARLERDSVTAVAMWSVASLAIAILATFLLMWRMNRPLGELARAAQKLGHGEDPQPVSETGPAEIRGLARAFNQMKDDLRKGERERATFLAGISHDLRTPLARLRLDVEMLEGKVDPDVQRGMVEDLADMNTIIDQFIDFARSEAAEPLAPVDLSELATACAERATRSGASVRCELEEVPPLMLRPLALRRMVENLVGNAVRHAGGEVLLCTRRVAGAVTLAVLDRGPGIPGEMVERLMQPFTRMDAARSGSSGAGLGLAIASRIAALHGSRLRLEPREGGGLEARVEFATSTA
ncbi:MAG TPA: ATP-binding protein [Usitatibacter sp.]|nr:ATP-binding protein [Usitatibacter sp.]